MCFHKTNGQLTILDALAMGRYFRAVFEQGQTMEDLPAVENKDIQIEPENSLDLSKVILDHFSVDPGTGTSNFEFTVFFQIKRSKNKRSSR